MTRPLLLSGAICMIAFAATGAQVSSADSSAVSLTHDAWFRGLLAHDTTALSSVLAPDVTLAFANGLVMPRTALLRALEGGQLAYDSAVHHERRIRVYGVAAVVSGRSTLAPRVRNVLGSEHITYTATYIRSGAEWRMVAWQSTLIPASK